MSLESLLAKDSPWVIQNAIGIWDGESWLQNKTLEHYFGKTVDLQRAVKESQLLQKTGYKFLFEEARRQKYNCSMVMNWCLNEPYPNAGNNCLIGYPLKHRPAFYAVENSLRDRVFSARLTSTNFLFFKSMSTPARRNSSANIGTSKRLELKPPRSHPLMYSASDLAICRKEGSPATSLS